MHVADPAHTTLLRAMDGHSRAPLLRAPSVLTVDQADPELRDPGKGAGDADADVSKPGGGGDGGHAGGAAVCRPKRRCIWGDAVCRALLGERWDADNCDAAEDDEVPPELRGESDKPAPLARVRMWA